MSITLTIEGDEVRGEVALAVAPGTRSAAIEGQLEAAIGAALHDAAERMGLVLTTYPSRYARPLPGKNADGTTRYALKGRREGAGLVPGHRKPG